MPIMFNTVLRGAGLPLEEVRLLRHQDNRAERGRTPYDLWRGDRASFNLYQSHQGFDGRSKLKAQYWASFVGTPDGETLFAGIYRVTYRGLLESDTPRPSGNGLDLAGACDVYDLTLEAACKDLVDLLFIDWGPGTRAWIQRADRKDKAIRELRTEFKEPDFPGFLNFVKPLSKLNTLPKSWITALEFSKGVYLLTCPRTKEQYVGSAYGAEGFWHRWQCYVQTGHGGNIALKSRDPSDYQVSILEVVGSACNSEDIIAMEQLWKAKLQSQEMGLNRN